MLLDVIRALGRRWYVLVVGLLCTAGLAFGAFTTTPPEYSARGLILLLPSEVTVGKDGNPFLSLSGLEQSAGIVVAYFGSTSAEDEVKAQSSTAKHLVAVDDSTRGPVISVDVTDRTQAEALSTLSFLMQRVPEELRRLQDDVNVPSDAIITSMTLTADKVAEVDRSGTIRMVIAAVVVGLLVTGIVAFILDGIVLRRNQRRRMSADIPGPIRTAPDPNESTAAPVDHDIDTVKISVTTGHHKPVLARNRRNR